MVTSSSDTALANFTRDSQPSLSQLAKVGRKFFPITNDPDRLTENREAAMQLAANSNFMGQIKESGQWAIKENDIAQLFSLTRLFDFLAKAASPHLQTAIKSEEAVDKTALPDLSTIYRAFRDQLNPLIKLLVPLAEKFFPDKTSDHQIAKTGEDYRKLAESFDLAQASEGASLLGLTRLIDFMARSLQPYLKMSETGADEVRSQVNGALNSLAERIDQGGDALTLDLTLNKDQEAVVNVKDGEQSLCSFVVRQGNELYTVDTSTEAIKGSSFDPTKDLPLDLYCLYHFPAPTMIRETGTEVKYLGLPETETRVNSQVRRRLYDAIQSKLMSQVPDLRERAARQFLLGLQQAGTLDAPENQHAIYLLGCNIGAERVTAIRAEINQ